MQYSSEPEVGRRGAKWKRAAARPRINGNGVGQFFSLSASSFLYLYSVDGTSPYERCPAADQGEALDKTRTAKVPFQPLNMALQRETQHFYGGPVAVLHPATFRRR